MSATPPPAETADPNEHARLEALHAEAQHTETALRASEERFRCAFEYAPFGMAIVSPTGEFLEANPAFCALVGYTDTELSNLDFRLLTHPDDIDATRALAQRVLAGELSTFQLEKRYIHKDGREVWGLLSMSLHRDVEGRPAHFITQVQDISARKRAEGDLKAAYDEMEGRIEARTRELQRANDDLRREIHERQVVEEALQLSQEQLVQSQKLQALGQLAGGVAHEFNNLLTIIKGYVAMLDRSFQTSDPRRTDTKRIADAADRAAALTRQLLAFGRNQRLSPKLVDLNELITTQQQTLSRLIGERVQIAVSVDRDLGLVRADPVHIEQAFLNLVLNARDAMPDGGTIQITTENLEGSGSEDSEWAGIPAGPYVSVRVADSGVGMTPDELSRLFEPFYTTKPTGKGTGLGLSTVYGIVTQSGGYVRVTSQPGAGSAFTVLLPRVESQHDPVEHELAVHRPTAGSETVLLVEDEHDLRELAKTILLEAGYHVLDAPTGDEAIAMSARHAGSIDLLLSDVVMPGMTGPGLARRLALSRPDTRILYASGYPTDMGELNLGARTGFLQKPFTPDTLLGTVRSLLNKS